MIPAGTKVYFALAPVDLRRSFDGLSATAASALKKDPLEGGLFVFLNKRANQVRVLFRDPHGWCILAKRIDHGRFRRPRMEEGRFCWETDSRALMSFLEDVDLCSKRSRRNTKNKSTRLEVVQ